ncbi:ribonuclease H family protein [Nicoliella lavandulae]|uniref:ribonuclease H n=1 Tax=Nicoliella lavandulae TaxID=3082954 RepID=A0ABU8SIN7_9LACO
MAQKFYAVRKGHQPGIYTTWAACKEQVDGFKNPRFKGFESEAAARAFLEGKDEAKPTQTYATPATITVYTDGGSRNHGNYKNGQVKPTDKAAWAYLIEFSDDQDAQSKAGSELGATNNRMEVMALRNALMALLDQGKANEAIQVISDSEYVLKSTKQWLPGWKRRGWKRSNGAPVLNQELWQQIDQLLPQFKDLRLDWTKGHANNRGNQFVDKLLNQAMDQMGQSGTIKVSKPAPKDSMPVADEKLKQDAINNINGVLNGEEAPKQLHPSSDDDQRISPDESARNISESLKNLNQNHDNND